MGYINKKSVSIRDYIKSFGPENFTNINPSVIEGLLTENSNSVKLEWIFEGLIKDAYSKIDKIVSIELFNNDDNYEIYVDDRHNNLDLFMNNFVNVYVINSTELEKESSNYYNDKFLLCVLDKEDINNIVNFEKNNHYNYNYNYNDYQTNLYIYLQDIMINGFINYINKLWQ